MKGFNLQAVLLKPPAGPQMILSEGISFICVGALVQALAQQVGKEMVITIPFSLVVERNEEQVGAFKMFEGLLSIRLTCDGVS